MGANSRRKAPARIIAGAKTVLAAGLVTVLAGSLAAPAGALEPSRFDPATDIPPAAAEPKPPSEMRQSSACATSAVLPDSQFSSIPAGSVFGVDDLHRYADGDGQTVAVIDSGVSKNVRLPKLRGGGDFILGGDGLEDCDHHGTLIAGIIGASHAQNDGFSGVAPGAEIVSVRQTSAAYTPKDSQSAGASTLTTLASAVRRAADEGATVINMSVTACVAAGSGVDLSALKGALHYAAVEKDAVVVASAGNVDQTCTANPDPDPARPSDPRGWDEATTISLPSYVDDFVLSVGGTTLFGEPYAQTLPGPWVDVSAPALSIVSLDPTSGDVGGLINAEITGQGETVPIAGTSFAAAYVSGLAALVRQRYPSLSAAEVRSRIINTAHPVADGLANTLGEGGVVDPVNALTAVTDADTRVTQDIPSSRDRVPPTPDNGLNPAVLTFVGILVVVLIAGGAVAVLTIRNNARRDRDGSPTKTPTTTSSTGRN